MRAGGLDVARRRLCLRAGRGLDERAHLVGIQACLWTEHVHDEAELHRFLFPRLDAVAERAWTGRIAGGVGSVGARSRLVQKRYRLPG